MKKNRLVNGLNRIFWVALALCTAAHAEPEKNTRLQELQTQFEESQKKIQSSFATETLRLATRYESELKKLEDGAAEDGNLDFVLEIQKEAKGFRERDAGTTKSKNASLARVQEIYDGQAAKIEAERTSKLQPLLEKYRRALTDLQTELTKARKFDLAVEVKSELERLGKLEKGSAKVAAKTDPDESTDKPSDTFDRSESIEGFDFGQPGKVRAFGLMIGNKPLETELLTDITNAVDVVAGHWGWTVLCSDGTTIHHGSDKILNIGTSLSLAKGDAVPGRNAVREDGRVTSKDGKLSSEGQWGEGKVTELAVGRNGLKIALKGDRTVIFAGGNEKTRQELNLLAKDLTNVVSVDASTYSFFALTEGGEVLGWRAKNEKIQKLDLTALGDDIVQIDAHYWGVLALNRRGKVLNAGTGGEKVKVSERTELRNIKRIWAAGDVCGVALDARGKLHAWARDRASVQFVEQIEQLKGFKDLAIMDVFFNGKGGGTFVLWIE